MHIDNLDHLVLTVQNIDATCAFYQQVLGMQIVIFGEGRRALQFGRQKNQFAPGWPRVRAKSSTSHSWLG